MSKVPILSYIEVIRLCSETAGWLSVEKAAISDFRSIFQPKY